MNEEIESENVRIHSRADELIACLEGEIAKRDARIMGLESQYQRDVYGLNNEGDPIGGEPAGGYANDNARLRAELAALKAQDTVGEVVGWYRLDRPYEMTSYPSVCATWHKLGAPVAPLYAAPVSEAKAQGVVMPERACEDSQQSHDAYCMAVGRNKALDEVARLNAAPVQQVSVPDGAFASRAITHYEAALLAAFPSGSSGEVFNQWNEARRVLAAAHVQQVSVPDGFCIGAWRDALEKIAKYAPQVNCAARTELERAGLIAVHALIAFSAPQFRHARGTQTASNAAPAAPAADTGHVFYGMDGNHP